MNVAAFEAGDRGRPPLELPLYLSRVPAGFASPADDHVDRTLSLDEYCISNPAATHLAEVEGDSMIEAGFPTPATSSSSTARSSRGTGTPSWRR